MTRPYDQAADGELWGDVNWDEPGTFTDIVIDADPPADDPNFLFSLVASRSIEGIKFVGAIVIATAALTWLGDKFKPENQTPTFASTQIDGCYISDNWVWDNARLNMGIDDLVLRNTEGVTSESGEGARCLEATRKVVIYWANHDDISFNDIRDTDAINPTVIVDAPYAIPLFADSKPQS